MQLRNVRQPSWVSRAAEEYIGKYYLQGWEWANANGEKGLPYDFVLGDQWADVKSSRQDEHLMVSEAWLSKRVRQGKLDIAVIAVAWDARLNGDSAFTALGWCPLTRVVRQAKHVRFHDRLFRFVHRDDLQPMRTLPS